MNKVTSNQYTVVNITLIIAGSSTYPDAGWTPIGFAQTPLRLGLECAQIGFAWIPLRLG